VGCGGGEREAKEIISGSVYSLVFTGLLIRRPFRVIRFQPLC